MDAPERVWLVHDEPFGWIETGVANPAGLAEVDDGVVEYVRADMHEEAWEAVEHNIALAAKRQRERDGALAEAARLRRRAARGETDRAYAVAADVTLSQARRPLSPNSEYDQVFDGGDRPFMLTLCAHRDGPSISFDSTFEDGGVRRIDGRMLFCRNVTLDEMAEHIARCQSALDEARYMHGSDPAPRAKGGGDGAA